MDLPAEQPHLPMREHVSTPGSNLGSFLAFFLTTFHSRRIDSISRFRHGPYVHEKENHDEPTTSNRFYLGRVAGGDRHHRGVDLDPASDAESRPRVGEAGAMP